MAAASLDRRRSGNRGESLSHDRFDPFAPDHIEQGERWAGRTLRAAFELRDIAYRQIEVTRKVNNRAYAGLVEVPLRPVDEGGTDGRMRVHA